ncbi:hypothetical protein BY996DRAFT_6409914 [Phakopsora pachyrhizi]|nr:hypothetical protein BY996DRAFT_6409914 [Phakopsora pachyrhizi]
MKVSVFQKFRSLSRKSSSSSLMTRCKFSSSTIPRSFQPVVAPSLRYNRPVGGFRAGILGFLTGLTVTGGYAYLHLFEEYQNASNALLLSVEELKASTLKITGQINRIEQVERELKRIESNSVSEDQVGKLKSELKKLIVKL